MRNRPRNENRLRRHTGSGRGRTDFRSAEKSPEHYRDTLLQKLTKNINLMRHREGFATFVNEIRCSKISENSENRHRAHIADPPAAKG